MTTADQKARAERFKALHIAQEPLLLFNCWDAVSARTISKAFPALATSSGAVAASQGYADGEKVPLDVVERLVARITSLVDVPVTVDFEAGYSDDPKTAAAAAVRIVKAGAIGINLEDGLVGGARTLVSAETHARKITAIRQAIAELGIPFFINSRTDTFLLKLGEPAQCLAEAITRGRIYADAGADGLFVPGLLDLAAITRLTASTSLPVNIMAANGAPPIAELARAGAKRISFGAWPMAATMRAVGAAANHVATTREYAPLLTS